MRYLVHDFGGYSFPLQLSRELAIRGHEVVHVYPSGLPGPKGRIKRSFEDSERLQITVVPLSRGFRKYSPLRRLISHRTYAAKLNSLIVREKPDVVLSADTPIDIQAQTLWHCNRRKIRFVHWVQDVYCTAIEFFLSKKFGYGARFLSWPFKVLEIAVAKRSNSTIVISPEFRDLYLKWGVPSSKIDLMENWAPLDELPATERHNPWSEAYNLNYGTVFLYSGTLGLKHRPDLLYLLAKSLGTEAKVVVVSEGLGREYLNKLPPLDNLLLLDFQPYERLAEVLAAADVLLAMLETRAGSFAVPSKTLSYLCAGRPILLAAPETNLAAAVIVRSGGGIVVDPENTEQWIEAAKWLASDPSHRQHLGSKARQYAKHTFDIAKIACAFEKILTGPSESLNQMPTVQP